MQRERTEKMVSLLDEFQLRSKSSATPFEPKNVHQYRLNDGIPNLITTIKSRLVPNISPPDVILINFCFT